MTQSKFDDHTARVAAAAASAVAMFAHNCATFGYTPKGRPLVVKEAAEVLGKHPVTLDQWRLKGVGPRHFKPEGTRQVYYSEPDLLAWLASGERHSTSDDGQFVDYGQCSVKQGGVTPPWKAA